MSRSAIEASRLGDLPDAGYATRRQREATDAIMFFMRNIERDRAGLLEIVCAGWPKWFKVGTNAFRGYLVDKEILLGMWQYMERLAGPNPAQQLLRLYGALEQRQRERWDFRARTSTAARKTLVNALADLAREQKKARH